ncbi:MAG: hypothetical protein LBR50_07705, partial [Tannerella sp.]|nr:hypothetical protein [Tannerella sp.]
MIDFTSFTLGAFPLYISNSNQCKEIIFNKAFAPILSSSGSVNIGVAGAGSNVAGRGNGTVRFKQPVTFTNGTGAIIVHGGNIEFESTAPYTYSDNTAYHEFIANSGCAPGNIHFQGGAVSVTKRTGETYWKAANLIKTEVGSTVTYNISGSSKTNWIAGDSIWLRNDVTFTLSTSDSTNWFAGNHIFAEYCSDAITYDHQGTGHITWKAGTNIELYPTVSFSKTNSNNGRIWWYAGNNINTHNSVTFTHGNNTAAASPLTANGTKWEAVNNIIVDQNNTCSTPVTVSFTNSSTTTTDDYMWWYAGNDVKVQGTNTGNRINVNFTNNAANSDASTNFMKWEAHSGNIDIDFATIAFSTTSNSKGYTEWYAYNNILMDNSSVDFTNAGTTSSAKTYWYAYNDDINANNTPITFNNTGEGYTHWKAGRDILLHDNSPTSFTDAATTDYIWLEANRDFRTGVASPLTIDHASPAYIKIEATNRNIWTQSSVDIVNSGTGNNTDIYAGMDIRLDSTLTYTASQPINYVKMRADQGDIIVNTRTSDVIHDATNSYWGVAPDWCDGNRAAVNFTLKDAGYTEWWAAHNIIATDSIKLHYDNKNVGDVLFHADQNNIDLRRPVIIDYGSTNNITFEAVNSTLRQNKHSSNGGSYNGTQNINLGGSDLHDAKGNIRTSDSVIINRSSSSDPGITKFEAYNDIQTAMVDFIGNSGSTGDTTYVNSKAGDLWLGYSWENPAACGTSSNNPESSVSFDLNRFVYNTPNATTDGLLLLTAGYDDAGTDKYGGGNIYFTHIVDNLLKAGNNRTEISIPYSNMFMCSNPDGGLYGIDYERAGIISGVWRCQASVSGVKQCTDTGLIHIGNKGELLVNAGTRGNIIFNNGGYLDFQDETGVTKFLTQWGDIDMRDPFNVDSMRGGLLFYANSLDPNKLTYNCGCEEKRNNVYLQDFQYTAVQNSGSVFVGADNNIKLNYGGLKNIATQRDPFFSNNAGYDGVGCGSFFHCDADTAENHARDLILNFDTDINGSSVGSGGFAAVSSDLIDVYKNMVFHGGQGSGMSTVPTYTTLHGASVAGYGLYILTQANKNNYTKNDHDVNANSNPLIGAACDDEECTNSYLHNTARVTFHADARIYTQAQKSIIASPVLETYGNLDLNTHLGQVAGGRTAITIRTDSLIMHDSLIIDGTKTTFEPWSDMPRNMPVFKLGHQRFT